MDQFQDDVQATIHAPAMAGTSRCTLRDVMDRVEAAPEMTEGRRAEMLSALRTVARCLGADPGDILANPASLRKKLRDAPYLLAGVGKRRWTGCRSLTLAALRLAGLKVMPGRRARLVQSPAWEALRLSSPNRQNGIGLSRFMGFCTAKGIEPGDVDPATFACFRQELENNSLVKDDAFVFRTTCTLWNRASQSIAGWPSLEVPVPNASGRYALDWSVFPTSLLTDIEAFLRHAGNQNVLAEDYAPSVKPATIWGRRKTIRQMATALVSSGFPIANIFGLSTLVQADNAKMVLEFFLDRRGVGNESAYGHAILLRTIARHWVPRDEENIRRLEKFCKRLTPKKTGMTEKNRGRLRQFDEPRNNDALLDLPANLLRQAQHDDVGGKEHLAGIVYAVAIDLLTVVPMRIKNLATLEVERHLIKSGRGALPVYHLVIPGDEVKNGVGIEVQLPKRSTELLMLYLETYRPRLCSVPSPWLFPNAAGQQRNVTGFGHHIGRLIHRNTGLKMNPHLFRHLSGKFILDAHPEAIETVRLILGHTSTRTTLRAYAEGRNAPAFKRLESVIDAKRDLAHRRLSKKRGVRVGA